MRVAIPRRSRWMIAGAAILVAAAAAAPASAKIYQTDQGTFGQIRFYSKFYNPDCAPRQENYTLVPPPNPICTTIIRANPCGGFDHFIASACFDFSTVPTTMSQYGIPVGDQKLGQHGLGTNAVGDTVGAADSASVSVTRSSGSITLSNIRMAIHNYNGASGNPRGQPLPVRGRFLLIVYPTLAAANADSANMAGAGSLFFGRVELCSGDSLLRGFTSSEFTRAPDVNGFRLTSNAGLTRTVPVPGGQGLTAPVVIVNDPGSGPNGALPMSTPIGITLLASALLAGGAWFMRSRQGTTAS